MEYITLREVEECFQVSIDGTKYLIETDPESARRKVYELLRMDGATRMCSVTRVYDRELLEEILERVW